MRISEQLKKLNRSILESLLLLWINLTSGFINIITMLESANSTKNGPSIFSLILYSLASEIQGKGISFFLKLLILNK
jgi:hypothetical protein